MGDIVFAPALGEVDDRYALVFDEAVEAGDEGLADRLQEGRRRIRDPRLRKSIASSSSSPRWRRR